MERWPTFNFADSPPLKLCKFIVSKIDHVNRDNHKKRKQCKKNSPKSIGKPRAHAERNCIVADMNQAQIFSKNFNYGIISKNCKTRNKFHNKALCNLIKKNHRKRKCKRQKFIFCVLVHKIIIVQKHQALQQFKMHLKVIRIFSIIFA